MGKQLTRDPYAALGVSSTKKGVHRATKNMSKGLYPGAFCQIVPMSKELRKILSAETVDKFAQVIHADGVGTKSNVAYLAMKEGITDEFLYGLAQDAIVMNTDDMACVGVTDEFFISNHIARNAGNVDDEAIAKVIQGYTMYFDKMKALGIKLHNTGGETADVGSYTTTMGIDVTASATILRSDIIDCSHIEPKNYIVGLSSSGKCLYESKENSGIRSNGLTLAIHSLLCPDYRNYPETMDPTIDPNELYHGVYHLEDKLEGTSLTIAEAILSPTRSYVPVVRDVLESGVHVTGIIHCSGGGLTKSINFGDGILYIKDDVLNIQTPAIFREIQDINGIEDYYMFRTFNMGVGMEIYVRTVEDAKKVIRSAAKFGIEAQIIGLTDISEDGMNHVKIGDNVYTK